MQPFLSTPEYFSNFRQCGEFSRIFLRQNASVSLGQDGAGAKDEVATVPLNPEIFLIFQQARRRRPESLQHYKFNSIFNQKIDEEPTPKSTIYLIARLYASSVSWTNEKLCLARMFARKKFKAI